MMHSYQPKYKHHEEGSFLNNKRNERLNQVTNDTLVVGIDIAKHTHYACAVDDRGRELHLPFKFKQNEEGFHFLYQELQNLRNQFNKKNIIIGFEPTGHYWLNLASFLLKYNVPFVVVNPMHVHRTKEFDDNLQTKHDKKDARVIAKLITGGYFSYPRIPEGVEAELRRGSTLRWQLKEEQARSKNRMIRWLDQYFPEFTTVFKGFGQLACAILKHTPLPEDVVGKSTEELANLYRDKEGIRSPSQKKIYRLQRMAEHSIAITYGVEMARFEIRSLIDRFNFIQHDIKELNHRLNVLGREMTEFEYLASIPGISENTVVDLLAEAGSLTQYENPRQLIKLAGLTLRENSSGKHSGQKRISKRGRKRLRSLLYKAVLPLLHNNSAFMDLYTYYISRKNNPLKKKEAMVVLCGKLLKIFFGLSQHHVRFNEDKMREDLHCLRNVA